MKRRTLENFNGEINQLRNELCAQLKVSRMRCNCTNCIVSDVQVDSDLVCGPGENN